MSTPRWRPSRTVPGRPGGSRRSSPIAGTCSGAGPTAATCSVWRCGRWRVIQNGKEVVRITAAFSDLAAATGRTVTPAEKPALPRPEEAVDLLCGGAILDLGEVGSATVELTVHVRARPAPGWLACRSTPRFVAGGFHEEDFEIWDGAGVLVAQSRQLALLPCFFARPPRTRGSLDGMIRA